MTGPLSQAAALRQMRDENERLKDDLEQLQRRNETYRAFVHDLVQLQAARSAAKTEADLVAYLQMALATAIGSVAATDGSLLMVDSDTQELVFMQVAGTFSASLPGYRIPTTEGIAGWVFTHGSPQVVNTPYRDPRFSSQVDAAFNFKTHNLLAVPIRGNSGVLGVLEALNKKDGHPFDHQDLDILCVVADLLAGAITRVDIATRSRPPSDGA